MATIENVAGALIFDVRQKYGIDANKKDCDVDDIACLVPSTISNGDNSSRGVGWMCFEIVTPPPMIKRQGRGSADPWKCTLRLCNQISVTG